jgi:hypothetical protein
MRLASRPSGRAGSRILANLAPLILTIVLGTPVLADAGELLLWTPTPELPTEEHLLRAYRLQHDGPELPAPLEVGVLLQDDGQLLVLGDARLRPCAGAPTAPEAFESHVEAAASAVAYVDYDAGAAALGAAHESLPCLSGPVSPEALSRYYFLRGLVAYYRSGPEQAQQEFRAGLLVSPFLQWDPVFPPDALPAFEAALADALKAERAFLSLSQGALAGGRLWLDGVEVDRRTRTTPIFAGTHLFQWSPDGGEPWTFVGRVDGGGTTELVVRDDLAQGFLDRTGSPIQLAFMDGRVKARLDEANRSAVLAEPAPVPLFHRFDPESETWQLADVHALEVRVEAGRRQRRAGGGLIAAGIAASVAGSLWAIASSSQAETIRQDLFGAGDQGTTDGQFETLEPRYASLQAQTRTGWVLAGVGGAAVVAGIPILAVGSKAPRPHEARGRPAVGDEPIADEDGR